MEPAERSMDVMLGDAVDVECAVLEGKPEVTVTWSREVGYKYRFVVRLQCPRPILIPIQIEIPLISSKAIRGPIPIMIPMQSYNENGLNSTLNVLK